MLRSARSGSGRDRTDRGRSFVGHTERLEQRTMLSAQWPGAVVGVTPGSTAAGSSPALQLVDNDGAGTFIREYSPIYPIGAAARSGFVGPRAASAAPRAAATGLDIVLKKGPNLLDNAAASAAFDSAAAFFESIFHDPITVVIDAEIAPLGFNVLGQAMSVRMGDTFDTIRDYVVADANPADEAFVSQLPAESGFYSTMPDGSFSITGATANRANLLALGVPAEELNYGPDSEYDPSMKLDASITFSSEYPFDYDRSNGITPGRSDFVGVAIHEIGHSLGFVSAVDEVEAFMEDGRREVTPTPLDLFRFEPGAGGSDFAGGYRVLSPGEVVEDQVFFDGGLFDPSLITQIGGLSLGDIPFSTGARFGDDWQASHWKDDALLGGTTIGTMDPQAPNGLMTWTAVDSRAMSLIGWDTAPGTPVTSITGTVYEDVDGNGALDGSDTGLAGWTVYQDANGNGSPDTGEATAVTGGNGTYAFSGVTPGTYTIRQVSQARFRQTAPTGSGAHSVTVAEGDVSTDNDFGNEPQAGASISGTLYDDTDADGRRDPDEIGMHGWTIYQDLNNNGQLDEGVTVLSAEDTPVNIFDNRTSTSQIVVSGLSGVVTDLNVRMQIYHTWTEDLTVTVVAPNGRRVQLVSNLGNVEDFDGTVFDDEAEFSIQDDVNPFTGTYRPMSPLSALDGVPMNGTWKLEVRDDAGGDTGIINDFRLIFETGVPEPFVYTDSEGYYEFTDVAPGTYRIRQVPDNNWTQTEPPNNGAHTVTLAEGQQVGNRNFGNTTGAVTPHVVGRYVFYNRSLLDGNDPAANESDDDAIAFDKLPLLAGEGPATFDNYTSYSRGINGVMIDIANLPDGDSLSAADFTFAVGNDDNPGGWEYLSQEPTSITVRRGAGESGSDRITIVWPDNAVKDQWLQVTVQPDSQTGLEAADVFYFGNLAGESGGSDTAAVNGFDLLALRRSIVSRDPFRSPEHDFNQDGKVNALDMAVVRGAQGKSLTLLSAPAAAAVFSEVPVAASTPATTLHASRVWDETPASLLA